jgi:hypothetical protein
MLWGAWDHCLRVHSGFPAQRWGQGLALGIGLNQATLLTGLHLQAALFAQAGAVHASLVTLFFVCLLALSAAEVLVPFAQQLQLPCCIRVHGQVLEGHPVDSSRCRWTS